MASQLPKFDSPPVIETVLSVQFARLQNYSNAHAGWFWKSYLDDSWVLVNEAPRLDDQFERFGKERRWGPPGGKLSIRTSPTSERLQIMREDQERMIQIQDSRFVYNWKKESKDYPSYEKLLPEFNQQFRKFQQFVKDSGNKGLELNQWEVTYVNHIEKGELWDSPDNWKNIVPKFSSLFNNENSSTFDSFRGEWHYEIGDNRGRLHVQIGHARLSSDREPEILIIQNTARGQIDAEKDWTLESGFNIGHETIVKAFESMTSGNAHRYWQKKGASK